MLTLQPHHLNRVQLDSHLSRLLLRQTHYYLIANFKYLSTSLTSYSITSQTSCGDLLPMPQAFSSTSQFFGRIVLFLLLASSGRLAFLSLSGLRCSQGIELFFRGTICTEFRFMNSMIPLNKIYCTQGITTNAERTFSGQGS